MVQIEIVVKFLTKSDSYDESFTQRIQNLYDSLVRNIMILYELLKRSPDHGKSPVEIEKLINDTEIEYNDLLDTATGAIGPAKNFIDLVELLPKPKLAELFQIMKHQESLQKIATNAVERWLHKSWLGINPSNMDRIRIELAESSVHFRQQLNSFLDLLEDKNVEIKEISNKMSTVCRVLVDLINQAILLAKSHMILHDRKNRNPAVEIKLSDIRILKEFKNDIAKYITNSSDE